MAHSRKDKYKGRHLVKERLDQYKRRQQGCSSAQERTMDEKDNSRSNNVEKDNNNK